MFARLHRPPSVDGPPELVVDGDFRSPAPLDRRIAAVWLRTTTNNPTEGYEVSVSAAFGTERITLKAGEFELETEFSLKTADIELAFIKCDATLLTSGNGHHEGWTTTRTEDVIRGFQRKAGASWASKAARAVEGARTRAAIGGTVGGEASTSRAVAVPPATGARRLEPHRRQCHPGGSQRQDAWMAR